MASKNLSISMFLDSSRIFNSSIMRGLVNNWDTISKILCIKDAMVNISQSYKNNQSKRVWIYLDITTQSVYIAAQFIELTATKLALNNKNATRIKVTATVFNALRVLTHMTANRLTNEESYFQANYFMAYTSDSLKTAVKVCPEYFGRLTEMLSTFFNLTSKVGLTMGYAYQTYQQGATYKAWVDYVASRVNSSYNSIRQSLPSTQRSLLTLLAS